eukprot:XP_015575297.1 protein IQ-DOMAIN 31 [Ricinus communis]
MGKSPGKWIKSFFRGKKSSKSNLSKGNDISKSASKGEILISSKPPVSDTTVEHSLIAQLAPTVAAKSGAEVAVKLPDEEFAFSCAQGDKNAKEVTNLGSQEDPVGIRHEAAATKAQAAIRGYLARRQFRTLKGIIRLQALIRGHLVRRQAVASLCCVCAVVKLQALARGQNVRRSAVGIQVQNTCNLGKVQGAQCSLSSGICTSTLEEKLIKNVFAQKLFASSKGAVPLSLQCSAGEPNPSWEWLERWTRSHFWESSVQQKKIDEHDKVQKVETKQGRPKRNVQKLSRPNAENGSGRSAKESYKSKRNPRKLSSHPVGSVEEHSQSPKEKVNGSRRKTSNSTKEGCARYDVDSGKEKHSGGKSFAVATEVPEGANDMALAVAQVPDADASPQIPAIEDQCSALHECHDLDLTPVGNNGKIDDIQDTNKQLNHKDYRTGNENQKNNDRRSSFPLNIEHQENGVHTIPKVPSYMAPTESARARLRGQGSPRFSEDAIENTGTTTTRRHSLPSSTNGKFTSMSPRAQKLVHAASRGLIRSDRSLSASRDSTVSDKAVKAEWRR